MSQATTRLPDPDPAEIARRANEIRMQRWTDSRDADPRAARGGTHDNLSRRMQRAVQGASLVRWTRRHDPEEIER